MRRSDGGFSTYLSLDQFCMIYVLEMYFLNRDCVCCCQSYMKWNFLMALLGFEMSVGGISSIPGSAGLVDLACKSWGEKNLDSSRLKPKLAVNNTSDVVDKSPFSKATQ